MKKLLLIIFFTFITAIAIAGQVYTWTDANGVVHYTDNPGPHSGQIIKLPTPTPVTTGTDTKAPPTSLQGSTPATIATPQEQQQAITQEKQAEAYCAQAKANLSLLQETGRRIYNVSSTGQYHYFNDTERLQEMSKTQQLIKLYCPPTTP